MRTNVLVGLLGGILTFGGCGGLTTGTGPPANGTEPAHMAASGPAEEFTAADFFPSTPGMRWEYEAAYSPPLIGGKVPARAFVEVKGMAMIDGKPFVQRITRVEGVVLPGGQSPNSYTRVAEDGVYQIREVPERTPEFLAMPAKVTVGQRWSGEAGNLQFQGHVAAKETVDCGDQTYRDCLRLETVVTTRQGTAEQTLWLAPGIGMVRQRQEGWFGVIEARLTRFSPPEASGHLR